MKKVVYTCPYVPAEWIEAHGLCPSRIMPAATAPTRLVDRIEGICPYVLSFISELTDSAEVAGVIMTTLCDQMRRAFDVITSRSNLPAFLMNVPSTWQHSAALNLYIDELRRLSRFLVGLGGRPPSNDLLANVMLKYDSNRESIMAARGRFTSRKYSEAIAEFNRAGQCPADKGISSTKPPNGAIPLAVLGGPLIKPDFEIFDLAESLGAYFVLDATETGELGMCAPFDRQELKTSPLAELARAYIAGIPHPSQRPNTPFYSWLGRELADRAVQGIILRRYVWCDIWHAELHRLKEWTGLPVLDIDVAADTEDLSGRASHRIRAFLEMLQ